MNAPWQRTIFGLTAILFCALGLLTLASAWEGISQWWAFTSLPEEEARASPLYPIWTSGRIVPAALFLIGGVLNALYWIRIRRRGS